MDARTVTLKVIFAGLFMTVILIRYVTQLSISGTFKYALFKGTIYLTAVSAMRHSSPFKIHSGPSSYWPKLKNLIYPEFNSRKFANDERAENSL